MAARSRRCDDSGASGWLSDAIPDIPTQETSTRMGRRVSERRGGLGALRASCGGGGAVRRRRQSPAPQVQKSGMQQGQVLALGLRDMGFPG